MQELLLLHRDVEFRLAGIFLVVDDRIGVVIIDLPFDFGRALGQAIRIVFLRDDRLAKSAVDQECGQQHHNRNDQLFKIVDGKVFQFIGVHDVPLSAGTLVHRVMVENQARNRFTGRERRGVRLG
ncbi:hypothetical protein NZK35_16620 [Stieleria sp. ICT_E10.1]|nr:hypothetical protein [Stieleria sedimenti]